VTLVVPEQKARDFTMVNEIKEIPGWQRINTIEIKIFL
jgi:hypothetical protein